MLHGFIFTMKMCCIPHRIVGGRCTRFEDRKDLRFGDQAYLLTRSFEFLIFSCTCVVSMTFGIRIQLKYLAFS